MPLGISPFEYFRICKYIKKRPVYSAFEMARLLRRSLSAYQIRAIKRKLQQEGRLAGSIPNPKAPPVVIRVIRVPQPSFHRWQMGAKPKTPKRESQLRELHKLMIPKLEGKKVRRSRGTEVATP